MSELKVNTITNAAGGNTAQINGMTPTAQSLQGFRNRLINGNMVIDQRNAGAAIPYTAAEQTYLVDRFLCYLQQASKFTIQQNQGSVTPPAGFTNYLGFTSSAATTPGSTDLYAFAQKIEGFNTSDLAWGTASAQPITLSFWVRSSLTGTFGGSFFNSAANRNHVFSYTISAANTWEQKTVTIAGDTSGTWLTTSGTGIQMWWNLGSGSSNLGTAGAWGATGFYGPTGSQAVVGTSGATFYITGVQLEAGSVATPFERRPYGTELALCQRYAYGCNMTMGNTYSTSNSYGHAFKFPTTMRSTPSLASGAFFTVNAGSAGTPAILVTTGAPATPDGVFLYNISNNWTVGAIAGFTGLFSSEL
jgi:hypothetical protein